MKWKMGKNPLLIMSFSMLQKYILLNTFNGSVLHPALHGATAV